MNHTTKENSFCLTPVSCFKSFFTNISGCIFNPIFAVLSIVNFSLCAPFLVIGYLNEKVVYYFYLFIGAIVSYYLSKFYIRLTKKQPMSIDGVAALLGYNSSCSQLKPYDERMLKAIIKLNHLKIRRTSLFFDDLYGILFDEATFRRMYDIYCTHLHVIK